MTTTTKTFADLYRIAADVMNSNEDAVTYQHRQAASAEQDGDDAGDVSGERYRRNQAGRALLDAVICHEAHEAADSLTTAERLLVAAIIAARANDEPMILTLREPDAARDETRAIDLARSIEENFGPLYDDDKRWSDVSGCDALGWLGELIEDARQVFAEDAQDAADVAAIRAGTDSF